jgi:hypothetical protein
MHTNCETTRCVAVGWKLSDCGRGRESGECPVGREYKGHRSVRKKYEVSPTEIRVPKGTRVELKVHSVDETHDEKLDVYPEGAKQKGTPGLIFEPPR